MQYLSFLKWWLVYSLTIIGTIFLNYMGVLNEIWEKDASYISFITLLIFFIMSFICGNLIFKLCYENNMTEEKLQIFEQYEEIGWFMSEICLNLGMLGTIIGFCMMLNGFDSLDISKQQTVQALLAELGRSMATALYTTLAGLSCGQLLKVQNFIFSLELQKKSIKLKEAAHITGVCAGNGE